MRKLSGLIMLLLLSVVLIACGTEDEEDPAPEPTAAVESAPTEDADAGLPGTPAGIKEDDATPESGVVDASPAVATPATTDRATASAPVSTPVVIVTDRATPDASPVMDASPVIDATPVTAITASPMATPQVNASPLTTPAATPEATPVDAAAAQSSLVVPVAADATETPVTMVELSGMVVLNGVENEMYVLTDEGCVGLGQHGGLREGRQVVIRDETGTIVSVTELGASDEGDGCAWDFVVQVPESTFYSISIPMTFEHVFPRAEVNANGGEVVIELP